MDIAADIEIQGVADYTQGALEKYGSYVATDRALADVRDGLKPVQRRTLFTMHDTKCASNKAHKKCARITGETMGRFHPHGDGAIYGTLVNMVHDRYPLVEGHGNFGGWLMGPAASRYTECRLTPFGERCFDDIDVVPYLDNYSATEQEPLVLPTKVPLLLLNGSAGIGVGLSAGLPPHHLEEVVNALLAKLDKPDIDVAGLMEHIKGPDAGHGVLVSPPEDVASLYSTGKGTLYYRCQYHFEEGGDHKVLVLTSVAPGFSLGSFVAKCGDLQNDGLIMYCSDQSAGDGLRVLIGFNDPNVIKERILPLLTKSESYQFWTVKRDPSKETLDDKSLSFCDLPTLLQNFLDFRWEIETKRIQLELQKQATALSRAYAIAVANEHIDKVFATLKDPANNTKKRTATALAAILDLSEEQATLVLEASVSSLSRASQADLQRKLKGIKKTIKDLQYDLKHVGKVVEATLKSMLKYSDKRGMKVNEPPPAIPGGGSGEVVVMARANGYLLRDVDGCTKSRWFDNVLVCGSRVGIVDGAGCKVHQRYPSYFSDEKTGMALVGLIDGNDTYAVFLDESGKGCVMENSSSKVYAPLKDATKLVSACGINKERGDKLVAIDDGGEAKIIDASKLVRRRGIKARALDNLDGTTVQVLRLPPNCKLYDDDVQIKPSRKGEFTIKGTLRIIGEENYVLTSTGRRKILNRRHTMALFEDDKLTQCQPLIRST